MFFAVVLLKEREPTNSNNNKKQTPTVRYATVNSTGLNAVGKAEIGVELNRNPGCMPRSNFSFGEFLSFYVTFQRFSGFSQLLLFLNFPFGNMVYLTTIFNHPTLPNRHFVCRSLTLSSSTDGPYSTHNLRR